MPINNTHVILTNGEEVIVDNALMCGCEILALHLTNGKTISLNEIKEVL